MLALRLLLIFENPVLFCESWVAVSSLPFEQSDLSLPILIDPVFGSVFVPRSLTVRWGSRR